MRFRSPSASIFNVVVDGRVLKVFKYKKAAERFARSLSLADNNILEIEEVPVDTTYFSMQQGMSVQ